MTVRWLVPSVALLAALSSSACRSGPVTSGAAVHAALTTIETMAVEQAAVSHVLKVTGTLTADEDAEVAAETGGRVVSTPVERGSQVAEGTPLVTLSSVEAQAQADEAAANVAQLEARLGIASGDRVSMDDVPELKSARAARDLAQADFDRIKNLLDQKVVSQAEYDQRRTQAESARNQVATATNGVQQIYRQLEAARARAMLARKALADTVVRAPFAGLVMERKVSVGDYVTRGTKVATVVRVSPLRAELTVPEQWSGAITPGLAVRLSVDAYPGRTFDARIRFVAPALRADQRALVAEAIAANEAFLLKPGMFVAALIELPATQPSLLVPTAAVQTVAGVSHVFVVRGDRVEQRMITPGVLQGDRTEVTKGLVAGERVAVGALSGLTDGAQIVVGGAAPPGGSPKAPK